MKQDQESDDNWGYAVEDGIPIPSVNRNNSGPRIGTAHNRTLNNTLKSMRVEQSVFVPEAQCSYASLNNRIAHITRYNGFLFCTRRVVEHGVSGNRVWRINRL